MPNNVFLMDANSFITAANNFYSFDFGVAFWQQLATFIEDGTIAILDKVYDEILAGQADDLYNWIISTAISPSVSYRDSAVISLYGEVLNYVQTCGLYKSQAVINWSQTRVADPWLIATAAAYNYTIVTFEKPAGTLSPHQPNKNAKIPDVATHFGVNSISLFDMMRILGIRL